MNAGSTNTKKKTKRASDGGVYLVIGDDTEEFHVALRYAARNAKARRGHLAVLFVMDEQGFQHWGSVEKLVNEEHRRSAERVMMEMAQDVYERTGLYPALYIEEGDRFQVIKDTISNDAWIKELVLASNVQSGNPGPLVSYFTGKGLSALDIPLTIIPGNLTDEEIDALA